MDRVFATTKFWFYRFWWACDQPDSRTCFWAGYRDRLVFNLGDLTTSGVEAVNGHLMNGLRNRSIILQVFSSVFDRVKSLQQNSICIHLTQNRTLELSKLTTSAFVLVNILTEIENIACLNILNNNGQLTCSDKYLSRRSN